MKVQTIRDLQTGDIRYVAVRTADYEKCVEALKNVKNGTVCMKDIADDVLALIAPEGKEPLSVWDVRAESKRVIAYNDFNALLSDSGIILRKPEETIEDVLSRAECSGSWKRHVHPVKALSDAWDDILAEADNHEDIYETENVYDDCDEEDDETPEPSCDDESPCGFCLCGDSSEDTEEEDEEYGDEAEPLEVFGPEEDEDEEEEE